MSTILSIDESMGLQQNDTSAPLPAALAADLAAIFPGGTYTLLEKAKVANGITFGANTIDVAFTNGSGGALIGVDSGLYAVDGRKLFLYTYSGDNNLVI